MREDTHGDNRQIDFNRSKVNRQNGDGLIILTNIVQVSSNIGQRWSTFFAAVF
jgi:hypothetical protein